MIQEQEVRLWPIYGCILATCWLPDEVDPKALVLGTNFIICFTR
jgi:hypothetical protein